MGQYYLICNLDKKEYLYSHKFGDGLKLMEFGCSANGMLTGLTLLLAGDYADNGKFVPEGDVNLYEYAKDHYTDISEPVVNLLLEDGWIAPRLAEKVWMTDQFEDKALGNKIKSLKESQNDNR